MTTAAAPLPAAPLRRIITGRGPAMVALVIGVSVCLLGWRGVDQAAQSYWLTEVRLHGLTLWNNGWYGGCFPLAYSVISSLIAALVGLPAALVASAVGAAWAFDCLVTGFFRTRPLGSWYFATSTALAVAIGQLPYLSGEAFGLAALVALGAQRRVLAALLALAATLCSPLAGAFLAMACLAWAVRLAWSRYPSGRRPGLPGGLIAVMVVPLAVIGVVALAFPGDGPFPFPWTGLAITELLCLIALSPLVRSTPTIRFACLLYALATLGSFVVANPLGGNAPRLAASVGVALLACFVGAPRPAPVRPLARIASVAVVVPFAVWQWAPAELVVAQGDPATQAAFYHPLLHELARLGAGSGPERIEIPPTKQHWEAAYVAPTVSLARGWERQLDTADNPIFYEPGALTAASYQRWLVHNGISFVALPATALDYAAVAEGALLRSGRLHHLALVWTSADWKLWRVTDSPGLVSGPARLTRLGTDAVALDVFAPGRVTVRLRYNAFWTVTAGRACVRATAGGWTAVDAAEAGLVTLVAKVRWQRPSPRCAGRVPG
ncbi:MAG: hypothetical protein ACYC1D_19320 [Acidimicrobiales bacterium]